ncbi:MAG TPA: flagellar hook protein FlgE [Bryobacteraceae bacterium]|jgi:flagellar hook protein FlgE|nr:flagellar hook protein FlgE [Bryobacteraceae bacterium]
MFTSFSTALSALNATSTAIDVVGNNLANMNSTGFKASEMSFSDLVTQSLGAGLGTTQVGFGTATPITLRQFTQGAIQTTGGVLDGAISGQGFFVVQDPTSGNVEYTRAGNFQTDASGNLMTASGDYVQGWTADSTGQIDSNNPVSNIVIPVGSLQPPVATTTVSAELNLNSAAAADNTSTFSMPITTYDSLGTSHVLTLSFVKTGANAWDYTATLPPNDLSDPTTAQVATGSLVFSTDGTLDLTQTTTPVQFQVPQFADGATAGGTITWNLTNSDGSGAITQFDQPSASSSSAQDGQKASQLVNVGLGNGGTLLAQYSDGQQVTVGQVALASIRNPGSMVAVGNNNFMLSAASASPNIGLPGTGGRGTIQGGSIEASNVDIATEFTNLIVYQRGYEANGKVVSTADTLSQDTINLING